MLSCYALFGRQKLKFGADTATLRPRTSDARIQIPYRYIIQYTVGYTHYIYTTVDGHIYIYCDTEYYRPWPNETNSSDVRWAFRNKQHDRARFSRGFKIGFVMGTKKARLLGLLYIYYNINNTRRTILYGVHRSRIYTQQYITMILYTVGIYKSVRVPNRYTARALYNIVSVCTKYQRVSRNRIYRLRIRIYTIYIDCTRVS